MRPQVNSLDSWPSTPKSKGYNGIGSPNVTPSRSSRHKGITNHILYTSFIRKSTSNDNEITFNIGDPVIISAKAPCRQKWLQLPAGVKAVLDANKIKKGKGKEKMNEENGKGGWKGKQKKVDVEEWFHEDGLEGEKVAIIIGFFEDEEERMMVKLRWFARPGAVWGASGPEEEEQVDPYELYYTADSSFLEGKNHAHITPHCTDSLPVHYIVKLATICNEEEFARQPIPRNDYVPPTFLVKKVYDAKPMEGAEFIGDIDWIEVFTKGMNEGVWDTEPVMAEEEEVIISKPSIKRVREDRMSSEPESKRRKRSEVESSDDDNMDQAEDTIYTTPKKSRAIGSTRSNSKATPAKRVKPKRTANAISKAASQTTKRKKFKGKNQLSIYGVPPAFTATPEFEKLGAFDKAKALLHVSATPEILPRRDEERAKISLIVGDAILSQSGTCLYISGIPGTGKTATVHSVMRELQLDEDMDQFQFIEINGMKLPDPNAAFSVLWKALSGQKSGARQALASLENYFQTPDPTRKTTVVLVDELDQMITKKQDVIYNFFNWPHVAHSRLIVIAIANAMDLPEREFSGKIRSRLGNNFIVFNPYSVVDLEEILKARMKGFHDKVFKHPALNFLAKKVAGVLPDARRALDVARRVVEKVDQSNRESGGNSRLCEMGDVQSTYKEMTEYGSAIFVKETSLHQKILLLALSQCIKRAGIPEVPLGDVLNWHLDFLRRTTITPVPSQSELFTIVAELHSLRLLGTESQREDYYQRVRSVVENGDLFEVLKNDPVLVKHVPKL